MKGSDVVRKFPVEMAAFYECGMDEEGIRYWMTRPEIGNRRVYDRVGIGEIKTLSNMIIKFCGDCDPQYKRQMKAEGRCKLALSLEGAA